MKFKGTVWLMVALVAIIAYYYGIELPSEEKRKKEAERSEKVLPFEAEDVTEFALTSSAQTLKLKRKDKDAWDLVQPLKAQGDDAAAEAYLKHLNDIRFSRVVEEAPEDLSVYGLSEPSLQIRLKLKKNKELSLDVGDVNPLNQKMYVKRGGEKRVLLSGASREELAKTVFELRDKSLLQFDTAEVEKIRLKNEANDFTLVRSGKDWTVHHMKLKARGDKIEIDNYLHTLATSRIKEFVEENAKSLSKYGLRSPAIELELHRKGHSRPLTLLAGEKRDTSGYYGKVASAANVVLLGNQMHKILSKQFVEFMDRSLLEFKEENVSALVIKNGEETIRLARNGADWKITQPQTLRVDPTAVKTVLIDLQEARIKEFIKTVDKSPALFGLDFPSKTFTVHEKSGNTWTMKVGNPSINRENFFATRSEDGTVFSVSADTVEKLFRSLHDLRYKKLLEFKKEDIDRIVIAYPDRTFELETKGKGWALAKPEKIDSVPDFLGKDIVWTLTNLEYQSIVEPRVSDSESGLDKPRVTVSIWKGNENLLGRVSVGNATQDDEKRNYARVKGKSGLFTIRDRFLDEIPKDLAKFKS